MYIRYIYIICIGYQMVVLKSATSIRFVSIREYLIIELHLQTFIRHVPIIINMFQSLLNRRVVWVESGGRVNDTAFTSEKVNRPPFGKVPVRVAKGYPENAIQVSEGSKPLKNSK